LFGKRRRRRRHDNDDGLVDLVARRDIGL